MSHAVVQSDAYDFSAYKPGDVICISMREIVRRGQAESTLLMAAIANAATKAGLDWKVEKDEARNEVRVSFS